MTIPESSLREIRGRETLFNFLNRQLGWPVNPEDTFTYQGPTLDDEKYPEMLVSRIVPFTSADPFAVMLVECEKNIKRSHLREILRRIRRDIREKGEYDGRDTREFLFLCAEQNYDTIRFARFTPREKGSPKLSVFGWSRDTIGETRTAREMCLQNLALAKNLHGEPDWSQSRWDKAWDVERVTKEFFTRYHALFDEVEGMVSDVRGDKRFFTQRLFNRLMFINFLSKKRWLIFNGSHDYLAALWLGRDTSQSFYHNHLIPLFFAALNNPQSRDLNRKNPPLATLVGDVPYLNGGLFEQAGDEGKGEKVPDEAFDKIINDLFAQFNFTITESSPDDVEVAVDPEMLGKVFEELVNGRHETGSYYTPRPIVAFMCKEALKGFLGGYDTLVDEHDPNDISVNEAKALISKLEEIKVVDPACGSGAYLLGMLHELHSLHRALDTRADRRNARDDYQRKLAIIQNNLYGVDIDPFAVNIARLRLWLSLAVEHGGDSPEPLPNLDFKIEEGDSLLSPNPSVSSIQTDMVRDLTNRYIQMKSEYADPYMHLDKPTLRRDIETLERELAGWAHGGERFNGFDWNVRFSEVYASGRNGSPQSSAGFDIVLANPPYVRQELIKDLKPALESVYKKNYRGTADLYVYFYLRGLELLREGGMLAFISSNKWFRAAYGSTLRRHISETCRVESITDFGDLPVFESATAYPMIFVARKNAISIITDPKASSNSSNGTLYTHIISLEEPYPDVLAVQREQGRRLPDNALRGEEWRFAEERVAKRLSLMESSGVPLGEYVKGQIFYGIKTGFNEAFVIDGAKREELIREDPKSAEIIKPLVMGKDIKRWCIQQKDRYLIFTRRGINIDKYPAIKNHLLLWKQELTPKITGNEISGRKPGSYKWFEIQDNVAYYEAFNKAKILFPDIAPKCRFAFDENGYYLSNTGYIIPIDDLFLLSILNSNIVEEYYIQRSAQVRGGYLRFISQYVSNIPIPKATPKERNAISILARKCLDAKGVGCEAWEAEIDERVERLYFGK